MLSLECLGYRYKYILYVLPGKGPSVNTLNTSTVQIFCDGERPQEGRVYACGEGTNGRLGLGHSNNVSAPRQITALAQYVVKKVAVHSGGKHAMALTVDGR